MNGTQNRNQGPRRSRPPSNRQNVPARQRENGSSGNASRNYERYLALAREAATNGDVIEAENYFQHAEHYFRVMRER